MHNEGYKRFIEENLEIVNKGSEIVPFILNSIQTKYLTVDYTGRDVILKARQQGFSSLILALFTADFLLKENSRSIIVADIADNAIELLDRVKSYIKAYEYINKVQIPLRYNSKYELFNEATNSRYTIGTADNTEFGRSKTITNLHLSEFAFYKHPEKLFAGAMQAVVPTGRVIIESTANGYNFFKGFWDECVLGRRPFKANFYRASDFYSPEILTQKKAELGRFFVQEYPNTANEAFIKATGLVYTDFDTSIHIKELPDFKPVYYIRGLDRGFRNPTAACWIGVDKDDVWYQMNELYEVELTNPPLAKKLKEIRGDIEPEYSTMDSAQASDIMDLSSNFLEDFIPVKKESGDNKINYVRYKIEKFADRLRTGRYYVNPKCKHTIEEFLSYRWKDNSTLSNSDINHPEEPEKANDHMMDALGDLNAMYLHDFHPIDKKPWEGKLPGTYIPPAQEEIDQETSFFVDRPEENE